MLAWIVSVGTAKSGTLLAGAVSVRAVKSEPLLDWMVFLGKVLSGTLMVGAAVFVGTVKSGTLLF